MIRILEAIAALVLARACMRLAATLNPIVDKTIIDWKDPSP